MEEALCLGMIGTVESADYCEPVPEIAVESL
jgi:hypothetical protein